MRRFELVEHRREGVVAGILVDVVRRQRDAVGVERVEGIFDLAQAAVGVRQRQRREMAEPALVVPLHLGGGLVAFARERRATPAAPPSQTLGVEIDSTDTAMPSLSIASMAWLGCHLVSRS